MPKRFHRQYLWRHTSTIEGPLLYVVAAVRFLRVTARPLPLVWLWPAGWRAGLALSVSVFYVFVPLGLFFGVLFVLFSRARVGVCAFIGYGRACGKSFFFLVGGEGEAQGMGLLIFLVVAEREADQTFVRSPCARFALKGSRGESCRTNQSITVPFSETTPLD